jgi:hypothetical protein
MGSYYLDWQILLFKFLKMEKMTIPEPCEMLLPCLSCLKAGQAEFSGIPGDDRFAVPATAGPALVRAAPIPGPIPPSG